MVECVGLENRSAARYRGFESHPLYFNKKPLEPKILGLAAFLFSPGNVNQLYQSLTFGYLLVTLHTVLTCSAEVFRIGEINDG